MNARVLTTRAVSGLDVAFMRGNAALCREAARECERRAAHPGWWLVGCAATWRREAQWNRLLAEHWDVLAEVVEAFTGVLTPPQRECLQGER